jgi:hypothetical protein
LNQIDLKDVSGGSSEPPFLLCPHAEERSDETIQKSFDAQPRQAKWIDSLCSQKPYSFMPRQSLSSDIDGRLFNAPQQREYFELLYRFEGVLSKLE